MSLEKDQHFMVDPKIIKRIVSLAGVKKGEPVLEIGPGTGNLTEDLAKTQGKITAIEIDTSLGKELKKRTKPYRNVEVLIGNGLDYIKKRTKINKIVSNLPYAICEPLFQILFLRDFEKAVLTVPRKFYENLLSGETALSFFCNTFLKVEKCFDVPREAFHPKPRTDSVVITLAKKKETLLSSVLKRQTMLFKNSLREALCEVKGLTKNQSREKVKGYGLQTLFGKRVQDLTPKELVLIKSNL
jgi:16S rRNA (adenine1518-N6/adenine1519-N6)-dimethyltransferase